MSLNKLNKITENSTNTDDVKEISSGKPMFNINIKSFDAANCRPQTDFTNIPRFARKYTDFDVLQPQSNKSDFIGISAMINTFTKRTTNNSP